MSRLVQSAVVALAIFTLAPGCGPSTATVTGDVSADGKPMPKGIITFTPTQGPSATANIVNGRYEIRTTPGEQRVQISMPVVIGTRKDSNSPNASVIEITEEKLPPQYHIKSELKTTLPPGSSTKDWTVETKPRK